MSTLDPNLPKLVLEGDTLETLTAISYDTIREASNNTLTDFRAGSPIAALVEGQVFALSELLYYANLLPEATALELFRLYGVTRSMGTRASGVLTFQLNSISNVAFSLPVGYGLPFKDSTLVLTETLLIPPGAIRATAAVRAELPGSVYNAEAYGVSITLTGLANLQGAYNETAISGGTDIESISDCIARMQRAINTRMVLINQNDYELAAQELLGAGSRAICIPKLGSDKTSLAFGNISVFLLNTDGTPANPATTRNIQLALQERSVIGTSVFTWPMELYPVSVELFLQVANVDESLSLEVFNRVLRYLQPTTYAGGYKVRYNELAYVARSVEGVEAVESVLLNNDAIDIVLPNSYTLPHITSVTVSQVSAAGQVIENVYSVIDAPENPSANAVGD